MLEGIVNYPAFLVASFIFAATPGIDTVFVLNKALTLGRRGAIAAALGINAGVLVHTVIGALGLSALLAQSPMAFTVLKWVGATYLVYLGLQGIVSKPLALGSLVSERPTEPAMKTFLRGLLTDVLNPKMALFVLAFFPQFMKPDALSSPLPFLFLGVSNVCVGTLWYLFFGLCAATLGRFIVSNPSISLWMNRVSGVIFVLLGAQIALSP